VDTDHKRLAEVEVVVEEHREPEVGCIRCREVAGRVAVHDEAEDSDRQLVVAAVGDNLSEVVRTLVEAPNLMVDKALPVEAGVVEGHMVVAALDTDDSDALVEEDNASPAFWTLVDFGR
jgi:hypothetical protein